MDDSATETKGKWWLRLAGGLKRSSSALGGAITDLVAKRRLDAGTIADIEDVLIRADLGLDTAGRIAAALGSAMHRDACGLVEDEHQAVAVEQPVRDLFRGHDETAITGAQ